MQKLDTISHNISFFKQAKNRNNSAISFKSGDFPYAVMQNPFKLSTYEEVNSLRRKDKAKLIPLALGASAMILTGCGKQELSKTAMINPDIPIGEQTRTPVPELIQTRGYTQGLNYAKQGLNINECYNLVTEKSQCIQGYNDQIRGLPVQSNKPTPTTRTTNQQTQKDQTGSLYRIKPQQSDSVVTAQPSINNRFSRFRKALSGLLQRTNNPPAYTKSSKQPATIEEACQNTLPSTVTIYSGKEIGSGSFVTPEYIITNQHVIKASEKNKRTPVFINLNSQDARFSGEVIKTDPELDLALVRVGSPLENNLGQASRMPENIKPVVLASQIPVNGDKVCAVGSPNGKKGTIDTGTFSQKLNDGKMESNLKLNPGNSGGPLVNGKGEVAGVNKSIWLNEDGSNSGISYSVPAPTVRQFVNQGISTK